MADLLIISLAGYTFTYIIARVSIYICLKYCRNDIDDHIIVSVYLPGNIVLYNMKVPMVSLTESNHVPWVESKIKKGNVTTETNSKKEQRFATNTIYIYLTQPQRLIKLYRATRYYIKKYNLFTGDIIQALHCEKLRWKTNYGNDDAANTAIIVGGLWAVKKTIISFLKNRVSFIGTPEIHVRPIFGQTKVEVDFECIFSLKLGKVIYASTNAFYFKRKGEIHNNG